MAVKIKFDSTGNVIAPTFVLITRSGRKLGAIPAYNLKFKDSLSSYSDMSFKVAKKFDGMEFALWDRLNSLRLVWCREWNKCFEITVELDETNELVKNVTATSLGEAELSQTNLFGIEINTETDISRDDYIPTVLYNEDEPSASLLHRIMEKVPHYSIAHVDSSIKNIQRTFTFDGTSIYDAFQEIAEEINCLFVINSGMTNDGKIERSISVYDLESYCLDCGHREEFTGTCPECGSSNVSYGYGEDTTIFASTENLAESITYSTDTQSVKNCFRLEGGDDEMTATIASCNPNGSSYIWYIPDSTKEDMSKELVEKLDSYDELYDYYQNSYEAQMSTTEYNNLITKYSAYSDDLEKISTSIVGYPALMTAHYNAIDFDAYLNYELMPTVSMQSTDAANEVAKLTTSNLSPVAVSNLSTASSTTVESVVLSMAKVIVDSRYQVKVNNSSYNSSTYKWTGNFTVTNYSDEEDTATSSSVTVTVNDDSETFIQQKINKALANVDADVTDIVDIFALDENAFKDELKKYCLSSLKTFYDACQTCTDVLVNQGVASQDNDLYETLYVPYYNKLDFISEETKLRESEIAIVESLQSAIMEERNAIQTALNFENYLGEELWLEFAAYRREDTYQNDNYISDGLNNAELFSNALQFIEVAKKEIYKSATLQHSITASLRNLLVMPEFQPLVDHFEVGNWIRVGIDKKVYRLRLLDYEIDFDSLDNISITFSDVTETGNAIADVLDAMGGITSSYGTISRQVNKNQKTSNYVDGWVENGLDVTNTRIISGANNQVQTWDNHGFLCREYEELTDTYDDRQLKILNSTIAITEDNWESVETAVGRFYYKNPTTDEYVEGYGINAKVLIGELILGEKLGIYNSAGSLTFDSKNGLMVTNDVNTFQVDPNSDILLRLAKTDGEGSPTNMLWVDESGVLHLSGDGSGLDISENGSINDLNTAINNTKSVADKAKNLGDTLVYGLGFQETEISGSYVISPVIAGGWLLIGDKSGTYAEISTDGTLSCTNANVSGNVTATSGKIGDCTISEGKLSVPAANITGTLNAGNINLTNAFTVYNSSNTIGGHLGYMSGSNGKRTTDGIAISNNTEESYLIVTTDGVRMQSGDADVNIAESSGTISLNCSSAGVISLDGSVRANQFVQRGTATITPTEANVPTRVSITFDTEFPGAPTVVACPHTTLPGTGVTGVGVDSVTANGFDLYLTRASTTQTNIYWIAVYTRS